MGNLTKPQVSSLSKPGRYGDGNGLYLVIAPTGTKNWVQRIRVDGKRTDKGLGGVGKVSLAQARKTAIANLSATKYGINPWADGASTLAYPQEEITVNVAPTFAQAALKVHDINAADWGEETAQKWIRRLEIHAFPVLADRSVDAITRRELAAILTPLRRANHETARKVRQAFAKVFRWVRANDYRVDDPADDALGELVEKVNHNVKHREALHYSEVAGAIHKVRFGYALQVTARAFEFLVLTAARTSEVRFMTWEEVDLEDAVWEIPADRMKAKRSHKVPLSNQAVNILRAVRNSEDYANQTGYVFTMPNGKTLSENAFLNRARKDNLGCVPHGFRSSWNDWAREVYGGTWEAIELSLAHSVGTTVSQAYFRTDLVDERRPMMQAWADYIDPPLF